MKNNKMKWLRSIFTLASFFACLLASYAQDAQKNVVGPSPTAAALGKYGDIPISLYTGTTNISIPIYTINSGSLKLPISLNYHASGIHVEDEASWCGLGWSLFSGGVITRAVRGLDDLSLEGNFIPYPNYVFPVSVDESNDLIPSNNIWNDVQYFQDVYSGLKDAEPDIFYFNFAGHSGKFFIKPRSTQNDPLEFIVESQEKIHIGYALEAGKYVWTVITADGIKYKFGTEEKTQTHNGSMILIEPSPDHIPGDNSPKTVISSWYIDSITSTNGDSINFTYTVPSPTGTRKTISRSEERTYILNTQIYGHPDCTPNIPPAQQTYASSLNINFDVYLSEINFKNGRIKFNTSARNDLQPISNTSLPQKLDNIVISANDLNGGFSELKRFEFGYTYFTNSDPYLSYSYPNYNYNYSKTYSGKRLKLNSLLERNGNSTKPTHEFTYHTTSYSYGDIPDKYSKGRDHWGFFNNANNHNITDPGSVFGYVSTMIPGYFDPSSNKYYMGANREINENQITLGLLKKIKYPTGGSTSFEYESNDYSNFPTQYVKEQKSITLKAFGEYVPQSEIGDDPFEGSVDLNISERTVFNFNTVSWFSNDYCNDPIAYGGSPYVLIRSTGPTPYFYKMIFGNPRCFGQTVVESVSLPPGTYKVEMYSEYYSLIYTIIGWEQTTELPMLTKKGGGVRILRTVDYDGVDHEKDILKRYKYTLIDHNNNERSSGLLMSQLDYEYHFTLKGSTSCPYPGVGVSYEARYLKRTSESNISIGNSAQGNPVGYSKVDVLNGENGENGKTVYTYINGVDNLAGTFFPNIPNQPSPGNGYLMSQTDYKRLTNGTFQKVKEIRKKYTNEPDTRQSIKGLRILGGEAIEPSILAGTPHIPIVKFYDNVSEWWHPTLDTTIVYDPGDEQKFSISTTQYFYDNKIHKQLTKTIQSQSDGSELVTKYLYPADYTSINSGAIGFMKGELHMHNVVIEELVEKKKNGVANVVKGVFTTFKDGNGDEFEGYGPVVPTRIDVLSLNEPKSTFISSLNTGTASDPSYIQDKSFRYDEFGNLKEATLREAAKTAYLWGYSKNYPVAEIKNAKYTDVFYTGFEDVTGNSNDCKLGAKSYTGSYTKSLSELSNGKYQLSYWQKTGGVWNLIVDNNIDVTTNSYTINLNGLVDEIRFHPKDAEMATYNYQPLVGMISQTDSKGMTTYYEYDTFQRLKHIKDQNGNIIKSYDYHYKP